MKTVEYDLKNRFIPAISGDSTISSHQQQLITPPLRLCGMAGKNPHRNGYAEYNASRLFTDNKDHIISQNTKYQPNEYRNWKEGREELRLKIST